MICRYILVFVFENVCVYANEGVYVDLLYMYVYASGKSFPKTFMSCWIGEWLVALSQPWSLTKDNLAVKTMIPKVLFFSWSVWYFAMPCGRPSNHPKDSPRPVGIELTGFLQRLLRDVIISLSTVSTKQHLSYDRWQPTIIHHYRTLPPIPDQHWSSTTMMMPSTVMTYQ